MKRRDTFQSPRVQNWPMRMRVATAAALVAAAPLMGWAILAMYLPGGHR